MNKLPSWLAGLLAAQVLLAGALFWHGQAARQQQGASALLEFDENQVSRIVIADSDASLTLEKSAQGWQLPGYQQLPADLDKVGALLQRLNALQGGWPVATTESSRARFEVAEHTFQRHLQLFQGERQLAELYLGSSPAYRKAHLRLADSDDIYVGELATYDLPTKGSEWLNKKLLATQQLSRIEGPDYALEKTAGGGWQFTRGVEALDEAKAAELASALSELQVRALAEGEASGEAVRIAVSAADNQWTYSFFQVGENYLLRRSDRDTLFSIGKSDFDKIVNTTHAQLVKQEAEEPAEDSNQRS